MTDNKNPTDRRRVDPEIKAIKARLEEGDREMKVLKESLLANTQATQMIAENTAGLIELYTDLAAGTRFLCRCALAIRWTLETVRSYYVPTILIAGLIWAIFHNLQLPPLFFKLIEAFK